MLVAIDVGNTQTVVGVFTADDPGESAAPRRDGNLPGLAHHWRVSTVIERTADEFALLLTELVGLAGLYLRPLGSTGHSEAARGAAIEGMVVSSSVPSVTGVLREMVGRWFDVRLIVIEPGIKTGMAILYDNPKEVGADRIVNAVAAVDLYGAPAIVVDLGTATTFDAISRLGEYLGGAIVPGIDISMNALFSHAAALPHVELVAPRHAIGRTTIESMQAGAIFGYAALVDGLCRKIADELGGAKVIATGGLAGLVTPHSSMVEHHEPWLTLHGLRLLFRRNIDASGTSRGERVEH